MANADPRTFDLFADDEQIKYPEDTVRIIRNRQALYAHIQLEREINKSKKLDEETAAAQEAKLKELQEAIDKSCLYVHMRGVSPESAETLEKSIKEAQFSDVPDDNPEFRQAFNTALIESMLVKITNHEGAEAALPQGTQVLKWFNSLSFEGREALLEMISTLTYSSMQLNAEYNNPDF